MATATRTGLPPQSGGQSRSESQTQARADMAILGKELRDRFVPALVLGVALGLLAMAMFWLSQSLAATLADISSALPESLISFVGGEAPGGYAIGELFSLIAPLGLVGYAVMAGAGAAAGEERKGSASMVFGTPVRRGGFLAAKALAALIALTGAAALFWLGALAFSGQLEGGPTVANITVTSVALLVLAVAFGSLSFAIAAVTGRPTIAAGIAGFLAAVSYISASVLPLTNNPDLAKLSPWYYYNGNVPLADGVDLGHLAVLIAIAVVSVAVAFIVYVRRDLRG